MMAYFTAADLRRSAGQIQLGFADANLRKAALQPPGTFDVFVSHSSSYAQLIYGLRRMLEAQGLNVYVDWLDDPQLDRTHVTARTARLLRSRMLGSASLIYATSRASQSSRWMPWELGYFDAAKGSDKVSIMPIEDGRPGTFEGEEYLGLYKTIQKSIAPGDTRAYAVNAIRGAESLRSFARGESRYERSVRL
jgi:hypothetical protein